MTVLLLFDFSKAFDSVSHITLLSKLLSLGFSRRVVRRMGSYLSGRTQKIRAEGGSSTSSRSLYRGVLQGSVLGPLLFTPFIADITQGLVPGIFHVVYADDLQIYVRGRLKDIRSTFDRLGQGAEHVAQWAATNGLTLNAGKTTALIFGTSFVNEFNGMSIGTFRFRGTTVPFVPTARSLGVVLDSKLNWKDHDSYVWQGQFSCVPTSPIQVQHHF